MQVKGGREAGKNAGTRESRGKGGSSQEGIEPKRGAWRRGEGQGTMGED